VQSLMKAWILKTPKSIDERRENLCDQALFTGWSVNGGYAEYAGVVQVSE